MNLHRPLSPEAQAHLDKINAQEAAKDCDCLECKNGFDSKAGLLQTCPACYPQERAQEAQRLFLDGELSESDFNECAINAENATAPIKLKGFSGSPISSDDPAENIRLGHAAEDAADECEGEEKAEGYRIAAGLFEKATKGRPRGRYIDRARVLREEADKISPPTLDATPSFEGAVNMCLVVLENGTEEGKAMARDELRRYARELDRLAAQSGPAFDPTDTPMEGE